jgi:hypothetical protein
MHMHGSGPVDGYFPYLSSTRGKLQVITAVTIIAHLLFKFHFIKGSVRATCDNQGAIQCATSVSFHIDSNLIVLPTQIYT